MAQNLKRDSIDILIYHTCMAPSGKVQRGYFENLLKKQNKVHTCWTGVVDRQKQNWLSF